jgi:hypothetical protein
MPTSTRDSNDDVVATPAPEATAQQDMAPGAASGPDIPEPDPAQAADLLARLAAIDPTLDEGEKSISRARDQCTSILAADSGEAGAYTLEELARLRFTADHLTDDQARLINDAIRSGGWCI